MSDEKYSASLSTQKKVTKFECDYCGGFEVEQEAARVPTSQHGLLLQQDPVSNGRPGIKISVCIWCIKKVFDKVLK